MNVKKLLALISIVFICGMSSMAYSQNNMEDTLFDIQFIMNNEGFNLQKVYFDGFRNAIRNCVFESESALWIIKYCYYEKEMVEASWYEIMAGNFSIKNTGIELQYYLEQDDHVYKRIENNTFNNYKARYLDINKVRLVDKDTKINVNWRTGNFPFLQNLARIQEQHIENSLDDQSSYVIEETSRKKQLPDPLTNQEYSQSKIRADLFDIQFIINNEEFTLQKVYFEGTENAIRNCVFESESALWTIKYCHFGEIEAGNPWHVFLVGNFLIKDSGVQLQYYLERESNIYRNIEHGSLAFKRNLHLLTVDLIDGASKANIGWSQDRLPFLRTLARIQEQHIKNSL